jgi:DNA-directed RNA polymerase subunit alpha
MENILLPSKINVKKGDHANHNYIEISPCYFGYGHTLGNALRRVLLSSLPGAAVVAVKIQGVTHEFDALDHVQEDVLEILMNFKRLRLKSHAEGPVRLKINAKGEKPVTGADIEKNSDIEIVNPELILATLTDDSANFEAEIIVDRGRGYVSTEQRADKEDELGLMGVDALFSPVLNVGYSVEDVRVGQITDYDKLVMSIETDGTVSPQEALEQASKILIDYFTVLTGEAAGSDEETDK